MRPHLLHSLSLAHLILSFPLSAKKSRRRLEGMNRRRSGPATSPGGPHSLLAIWALYFLCLSGVPSLVDGARQRLQSWSIITSVRAWHFGANLVGVALEFLVFSLGSHRSCVCVIVRCLVCCLCNTPFVGAASTLRGDAVLPGGVRAPSRVRASVGALAMSGSRAVGALLFVGVSGPCPLTRPC